LTSLVVFFLTSDMAASVPGISPRRQRAAGLIAALAIQGTPLFAVYGFGMTTDTPLILIWASALGLFWWTTKRPPEPGDTWRWVLLGATIGIGILAKYTMALFYGCALIYLLANHRENRRKYFWRLAIASVTTLIFCTPIIWWNFAHGWVTLRHVAGQADFYDGWRFDLRAFGEFVGEQFGIITPILLILLFLSLSSVRKTVAGRVLWCFSIPILIFFLLKSLQGKVQGNWVLPAYASAMPALGIFIALRWQQMTRASRAMVVSGFAVAVVASIAIHFPLRVNRPFKMDPTARVRGWRQLGDEVSAIAANMHDQYFVFSDDFHIAPELSFYVRGQPQAYCANFGRRMTQYDIWPGYERLIGYNALMVTAGRSPLGKVLESQFDRCHPHLIELSENGVPLREYTVFECYGFKGIRKPSPSDY
jgi:undecaprenyl-diphosphatase